LIRTKRAYDDFESEIEDCVAGRCTLMRCTVGPLLKDESVLFKIRSRLFTETQKTVSQPPNSNFLDYSLTFSPTQDYANKVKISSKLVTRITRLPYQSDTRKSSYQVS
jgi:hypothetical protein